MSNLKDHIHAFHFTLYIVVIEEIINFSKRKVKERSILEISLKARREK